MGPTRRRAHSTSSLDLFRTPRRLYPEIVSRSNRLSGTWIPRRNEGDPPSTSIPSSLKIPNEIWYVVCEQLAMITISNSNDDDRDCNTFIAWLRTLRLVSRTFNRIFSSLGFRILQLASSSHGLKLANRSDNRTSEWEQFMKLLARCTIAIRTSSAAPAPDCIEVIGCIGEATRLRALTFPTLLPSGSIYEVQNPCLDLFYARYLRAFLLRSKMCRLSIVGNEFMIEETTSYDPYLSQRGGRDSTSKDHVNILEIAVEAADIKPKDLVDCVEVLHIKIPERLQKGHFGLPGDCEMLPPVRVLILENYNWDSVSTGSPVPLPWNFSALESLTLRSVDKYLFFRSIFVSSLRPLKRLVIIDCILKPDPTGAQSVKQCICDLFSVLPHIEELVILDDLKTYIDVPEIFNVTTKLRRLELIQIYHNPEIGPELSHQIFARDVQILCNTCPELRHLRLDLDMRLRGMNELLQNINDFEQLETFHLEFYDDHGFSIPTPTISTNEVEDEAFYTEYEIHQRFLSNEEYLYENVNRVILQVKYNCFGKALQKVLLTIKYWSPPSHCRPHPEHENEEVYLPYSGAEGFSVPGTVRRTFISRDGGEVEEVWGIEYD